MAKGTAVAGAFVVSLGLWDGLLSLAAVAGASWAWTVVQWSPVSLVLLALIFGARLITR